MLLIQSLMLVGSLSTPFQSSPLAFMNRAAVSNESRSICCAGVRPLRVSSQR